MKRIVFKLKHEPTDEKSESQEWKNYSVEDYPKLPPWLHFAGLTMLAAGLVVGYSSGHSAISFFAAIAAWFALVICAHPLRCPRCKGNVITREVEEENDFKRLFHDCSACGISWREQKPYRDTSD
jgi:hypothetical protein